jgi:hypothetical protein
LAIFFYFQNQGILALLNAAKSSPTLGSLDIGGMQMDPESRELATSLSQAKYFKTIIF